MRPHELQTRIRAIQQRLAGLTGALTDATTTLAETLDGIGDAVDELGRVLDEAEPQEEGRDARQASPPEPPDLAYGLRVVHPKPFGDEDNGNGGQR
jgi:hypothetical protein